MSLPFLIASVICGHCKWQLVVIRENEKNAIYVYMLMVTTPKNSKNHIDGMYTYTYSSFNKTYLEHVYCWSR